MTIIPLSRRFLPWHDVNGADPEAASYLQAAPGSLAWADLLQRKRVVILAEAGSGKTTELSEQARSLSADGKFAFYATVESVGRRGLAGSLATTDAVRLQAWASSTEDAWFFIDSIDQAKVSDIRLEDALRALALAVHGSEARACIILSGRYTDWEFRHDLSRLTQWLPVPMSDAPLPNLDADEELVRILDGDAKKEKSPEREAPIVVVMAALSRQQVRQFARGKGVSEFDDFMAALGRQNLLDFARRPLDLDWLVGHWRQHHAFGSLCDMLERSLGERLRETDLERARKDPLSLDVSMIALERIGAALVMQRREDVLVPDSALAGELRAVAIDLADALPDWTPEQRMRLLTRPVFDPARSGLARLHNDNQGTVRAYLGARWLLRALNHNCPLAEVRSLLFETTYGVDVIVPSMRPVAAWLALWVPDVANEVLRREPHLLLSTGDPGSLPLATRQRVLAAVVEQLLADRDLPLPPRDSLVRFAPADLASAVRQHWNAHSSNPNVRELLLMIIWQGGLTGCSDIAVTASYGNYHDRLTQIFAGRALLAVTSKEERARYLAFLERQMDHSPNKVPPTLIWDAAQTLLPHELSVPRLLEILSKLPLDTDARGYGLDYQGPQLVAKLDRIEDVEALAAGLFSWLQTKPDPLGTRPVEQDERLYPALDAAACRLLALLPASETSQLATDIALRIGRHVTKYSRSRFSDDEVNLDELLKRTPARRRAALWRAAEIFNGAIGGRPVTELWQLEMLSYSPRLVPGDITWLVEDVRLRPEPAERQLAVNAALAIWRSAGEPADVLARIQLSAADHPELAEAIEAFLHPPPPTKEHLAHLERMREFEEERASTRAARDQSWKDFAARLRADPACLGRSADGSGVNSDLFNLWKLLDAAAENRNRLSIADLSPIGPMFGSAVVDAARRALISSWRRRDPKLSADKPTSERNRWSAIDSMALVGLALESADSGWARKLTSEEATRAAILATYELNQLPDWIAALVATHGPSVRRVLSREIGAELDGLCGADSSRTLRHAIAAGPAVLDLIAGELLRRVKDRRSIPQAALASVIEALQKSGVSRVELIRIFAERLVEAPARGSAVDFAAGLFAIDESVALVSLDRKLRGLLPEHQASFVQHLLPRIVGGVFENGVSQNLTVEQVEKLVLLSFAKIQIDEDNRNETGQVFSLNDRDDAEAARGKVFQQLVSHPGPATYAAIQRLIALGTFPVPKRRLEAEARARASADSQFAPWTAQDVLRFERDHQSPPRNPQDLQRLIVRRLGDIQHELLNGDFAQASAFRRLPDEADVQRWVADRLRLLQRDSYTVEREPHVAEEKEPDIRVRATAVNADVPIEIKVAESWTIEQLEGALSVQLVGQYLRDPHNRFGVLLLVHQNPRPKGWERENGSWADFQRVVRHLSDQAGDIAASGWGAPQPVVAVIDVSSVELKEERLARLAKEKAERLPRRLASAKLT